MDERGGKSTRFSNPYLDLSITMVFFASAFAGSKIAVNHFPSDVAAALRFSLGGAILAIALWRSDEKFLIGAKDLAHCALAGSIGVFLYNILFFNGVSRAPAVDGALIVPVLSPLFTFAILCLLKQESATLARVTGLVLGVTGAAIFILAEPSSGLSAVNRLNGDLIFLAAAFSWAIYGLVSKRVLRNISSLQATTWSTLFGSLMLCISAGSNFEDVRWAELPDTAIGIIIFLAIGPTAIAYLFYYRGLKKVSPTSATLMMLSVPVLGTLFSFIFLGERILGLQILGATLLLLGAMVSLMPWKGQARL